MLDPKLHLSLSSMIPIQFSLPLQKRLYEIDRIVCCGGYLSLFTLSSCDKEIIISETEIPSEISTYVTTHFSTHSILQAIKDKDGFKKTYDLVLSGNINLEFNNKKEIIEIEGNDALPESVIPKEIWRYVATNYPDNFITDWTLNKNDQQIELNNGTELLFNKDGGFLRIDN